MWGAGFALGRLTEEGHGIGNGFTGKPEFAVAVNNVVKDEAGFVGSAEAGEKGGAAAREENGFPIPGCEVRGDAIPEVAVRTGLP